MGTNDFTLMVIYFAIALGVSFLCSILEAVLLSITPQYIAMQISKKKFAGYLLKELKSDINKPLTAILTLNTIAHTMGAAGVGAQVTKIYGNEYLTISSILLTIFILFLSEIIPKTIGTSYWQFYANYTAIFCHYLTKFLLPVIWISKIFTQLIIKNNDKDLFKRDEFKSITNLAIDQNIIPKSQGDMLINLIELDTIKVKHVMTPRTVLFTMSADQTVECYFNQLDREIFSRIPIYLGEQDNLIGFVMRNDLLLNQARGNGEKKVKEFSRKLEMILEFTSLLAAFSMMVKENIHIAAIINEYGDILGIITLEDIIEHVIGLEIIDEHDRYIDMQQLAKKINKNKFS